jgi:uncharacterized protein (DUF1499 family)
MSSKIIALLFTCIFLAACAGTAPKLGIPNGQLTPCPITPNCVNSQASSALDSIEPLYFSGTQEAAKVRLLDVLSQMKRTKVTQQRSDYVRAESSSAIFGFVDDLEFYFPAEKSGTIIIHTRSASRLGLSDLGVNRRRIDHIRTQFASN